MEKKGSRTMRKTWKKLAAMAVTASMVICGGAMGVSAATEEEPEKVTVNVAYMPDYASLNGLISAIELGYFDDENIDVQLTEFSDGPTIIQAMDLLMLDTSDREPTNFASTVKLIFLHLHMYLMVML